MILTHYSPEPIVKLLNREQDSTFKPKGLWVSDETDHGWNTWCNDNEFGVNDDYIYSVTVDMTDVLLISNSLDLLSFHHKYRTVGSTHMMEYIRWDSVAEDYKGIIITPYLWSIRMDLIWYYGWDCASGCVWDVSAITSITENTNLGSPRV